MIILACASMGSNSDPVRISHTPNVPSCPEKSVCSSVPTPPPARQYTQRCTKTSVDCHVLTVKSDI